MCVCAQGLAAPRFAYADSDGSGLITQDEFEEAWDFLTEHLVNKARPSSMSPCNTKSSSATMTPKQ